MGELLNVALQLLLPLMEVEERYEEVGRDSLFTDGTEPSRSFPDGAALDLRHPCGRRALPR